jgi:hypothetical protein
MRQLMMTVMVLTAFGAMVAAAQGQVFLQNGKQCFTNAAGEGKDGRFGNWGACPAQAAATATRTTAPPRRQPPPETGPDRMLQGRDWAGWAPAR